MPNASISQYWKYRHYLFSDEKYSFNFTTNSSKKGRNWLVSYIPVLRSRFVRNENFATTPILTSRRRLYQPLNYFYWGIHFVVLINLAFFSLGMAISFVLFLGALHLLGPFLQLQKLIGDYCYVIKVDIIWSGILSELGKLKLQKIKSSSMQIVNCRNTTTNSV